MNYLEIMNKLCKCSFPKVALEKYITKFQKSNYSFLIYDYKKEGFENKLNYKLVSKIEGKLNEIEDVNIGCSKCEYNKIQKINLLNKTMYELKNILEEENDE